MVFWIGCFFWFMKKIISHNFFNLFFEYWQVLYRDFPDSFDVNPEIFMGKHIPKIGYFAPGNLRMRLSELFRNIPGRFADNLQPANDGILYLQIALEFLLGHALKIFLNYPYAFQDISQINFQVSFHKIGT